MIEAPVPEVATLTGGGSGIGLAIAGKLVQQNVYTIIVGRNREKLKSTCKKRGVLCQSRVADISDLALLPSLVQSVVVAHEGIDIPGNNTGINMKKAFTEESDDDFQSILLTNVSAAFAFSPEAVKTMIPRGTGGYIINNSSMPSQYGVRKVIAYSASKSAKEGRTCAMASKLSPKGMRVNCIAPGFIATEMSGKALNNDPERKAKALGRTPMGEMGEPADIGDGVAFLALDGAKHMTGVVLRVDGGNAIGF